MRFYELFGVLVVVGLYVRQANKAEKKGIQNKPTRESYSKSTRFLPLIVILINRSKNFPITVKDLRVVELAQLEDTTKNQKVHQSWLQLFIRIMFFEGTGAFG